MAATLTETLALTGSLVFALIQFGTPIAHAENLIAATSQVPANLVPKDQRLLFKASAKGDQIYTCKASSDYPIQYEWTLKAPDAILLNDQGQQVGKHYAGPTWEAQDNSKVIAQVKSKANAPQANAIPWLLLEARSHEGQGIFTQVTWIQRLNTVGGNAPAQSCDETQQNREVRVGYSADYFFYGSTNQKN